MNDEQFTSIYQLTYHCYTSQFEVLWQTSLSRVQPRFTDDFPWLLKSLCSSPGVHQSYIPWDETKKSFSCGICWRQTSKRAPCNISFAQRMWNVFPSIDGLNFALKMKCENFDPVSRRELLTSQGLWMVWISARESVTAADVISFLNSALVTWANEILIFKNEQY